MKAERYYKSIDNRTAGWNATGDASPVGGDSEKLVQQIRSLGKGSAYLDIGCQAGGLISAVKDQFTRCYGVDIGEYKSHWQGVPDADFAVHDLDQAPLPFEAGKFRVVSCIMVMEHVFDVFGLVREIHRVLGVEGHLILEVPNIAYVKHIWSLVCGKVPRTAEQLYPFVETEGWDSQHLHNFTITDLKDCLEMVGLRVESIRSRGRFGVVRQLWPSLLYSSLIVQAVKTGVRP